MKQTNQVNLLVLSAALFFSGDSQVSAFSMPQSRGLDTIRSTQNSFMSKNLDANVNTKRSDTSLQMGLTGGRFSRWVNNKRKARTIPSSTSLSTPNRLNLLQKLRRTVAIFLTSTFLLLGPIQLNNQSNLMRPPSAHASTVVVQKSKANLDKIIDEYIKDNMFNDDKYDPLESTYRETIADSKSQSGYPAALSSSAQSVLGKNVPVASSSKSSGDGQAIKFAMKLVNTIYDKLDGKVSKGVIIPALFLVGGGVPLILILASLMSFSYSQKAMTERMAVERYGESVLDAEELAVKDDDDDDDEDDDDDDEDDDDEDDDDDDEDDD